MEQKAIKLFDLKNKIFFKPANNIFAPLNFEVYEMQG